MAGRAPLLALVLLAVGAAAAPRPAEAAGAPEPALPEESPAERRCRDLAELVDRLAGERRAADADTLAVLEAEAIARVADEILAEGDSQLAQDLFEEALALLAPERTEP